MVIRTSFIAGFHCPIYEHCYYYSKKEMERQEKYFPKHPQMAVSWPIPPPFG